MIAQRTRLAVTATNIAQSKTILDSEGNVNPYKRRMVFFAAGYPSSTSAAGRSLGVRVAQILEDQTQGNVKEYNPASPYAYKSGPLQGYVPETNVNPVWENVNAMEAARAYEANVVAAEATKTMMAQALRLLA
jgi:flagellar basal-body rod protein FlgC